MSSIPSQIPTTPLATAAASANPYNLSPADFINMMVTQLKSQDPMQPTSNEELMTQMADIGQLESSNQMQTTLQSITLQTQIGSSSALIGKQVTGIDSNNNPVQGTVSSVKVAGGQVNLELDTGDELSLTNVSEIDSAAPAATTTPPATTGN